MRFEPVIPPELARRIHPVPVTLRDGHEKTAMMMGKDVAWFCACSRPLPLFGSADEWSKAHPPETVTCPQCNRQYVVFRADENAQFALVVEFN